MCNDLSGRSYILEILANQKLHYSGEIYKQRIKLCVQKQSALCNSKMRKAVPVLPFGKRLKELHGAFVLKLNPMSFIRKRIRVEFKDRVACVQLIHQSLN